MIGLDIGSVNIKMCMANRKGEEFYEVYSAIEKIPAPAAGDDKVRDKLIGQIVKSMAKKLAVKSESVVSSIGETEILVRKLEFPIMPKEELSSTIKLQAERFIYSDLNDMDIDFHIISEGEPDEKERAPAVESEPPEGQETEPKKEEENKMNIIFVAVPVGMVNRQMETVQESGLNPVIMDIDNLAIANSYIAFEPRAFEETAMILNIGHNKTCFTVLNNGKFCFTRSVKFGGNNISNEIKKELEISYKKAEEIKVKPEKWKDIGLNIKGVLRKSTPDLLEAIYKSIEYCKSQHFIQKIDRLLISGGTSFLDSFDEFLAEILGLETVKWNPFSNIKLLKEKENGPYMSIALGLALRNLDENV